MEIHNKDDLAIQNQNTQREIQIMRNPTDNLRCQQSADDLNRVTKTSEPFDLSDSSGMIQEMTRAMYERHSTTKRRQYR